MNKLDKKLDRIIYLIDKLPDKEVVNIQEWQKAQIKATILAELEAGMPEEKNNTKDIRAIWDDTDFAVDYRLGYNRALEDCLAAIKHLLGDGE